MALMQGKIEAIVAERMMMEKAYAVGNRRGKAGFVFS
jgi:hypothetical protein